MASIGLNAVVQGVGNMIASGIRCVAFGLNVQSKGAGSVVIGANAKDGAVGGASDVVIGDGAQTGALIDGCDSTQAGAGEAMALGAFSRVTSWRGLAAGYKAIAGAVSATALGRGARAMFTHSLALGRGAFTVAPGDVVLGHQGDAPTHVYFSNSHTGRYIEPTDGGIVERTGAGAPIILHGMSGRDTTPNPIPDRAGADMIYAGGRGTGAADGGAVRLQVAPPDSESGTTENPLLDGLVVHPSRAVELFDDLIFNRPNGRYRLVINTETNQLSLELVEVTMTIAGRVSAGRLEASDATL